MTEPLVLVEAEGPILVVTINRPEKRNAANSQVLCRLYDAWVRLDTDDDIRVAILTGKGNTFCAGMDLAEIGRLRQGIIDNEWIERFTQEPQIALGGWLKTYRPTKPVILAAEGFARCRWHRDPSGHRHPRRGRVGPFGVSEVQRGRSTRWPARRCGCAARSRTRLRRRSCSPASTSPPPRRCRWA